MTIFEKTQAILNERGWARRDDVTLVGTKSWIAQKDKPICVGLAMRQAYEELLAPSEDYYAALTAFAAAIGTHGELVENQAAIWTWNDTKGRTKQDVDLVLAQVMAK